LEKNEFHGGIIRLSIGASIMREENPILLKGKTMKKKIAAYFMTIVIVLPTRGGYLKTATHRPTCMICSSGCSAVSQKKTR
jgi:hypothetical protein